MPEDQAADGLTTRENVVYRDSKFNTRALEYKRIYDKKKWSGRTQKRRIYGFVDGLDQHTTRRSGSRYPPEQGE